MPSDAVLLALIGAVVSLVNTWMIWSARKVVSTLEKQTNSIKDALVQKTEEVAFAEGVKQGKEEK